MSNIAEDIIKEMSEANKAKSQASSSENNEGQQNDANSAAAKAESDRLAAEAQQQAQLEAEKQAVIEAEKNKNSGANSSDAPEKTIDELLAERLIEKTGGKVKNFEDIEHLLTPRELEFANDEIKRLNELAKNGVQLDEDFWALQSKDFKSLDPEQVLLEAMRQDKSYKGWSDKELKLELDDKYKRKEWSLEGEEPTDAELLAKKRFIRDAESEREKLLQLKESRTVVRKPNEADIQAKAQAEVKMQKEWEQLLENNVIPKADKLSTLIDEKSNDRVDFAVPESDKKEVLEVMKQMRTNLEPFWNQFKNSKGDFDYNKIYDLLILAKHKDNLVKIVAQNYKAKGAEEEFKKIKNINFKTDGTQQTVVKTVAEKNAEAIDKAMRKAGIIKNK